MSSSFYAKDTEGPEVNTARQFTISVQAILIRHYIKWRHLTNNLLVINNAHTSCM